MNELEIRIGPLGTMRFISVISSLIVVAFVGVISIHACSCVRLEPCEAYSAADKVFVGKLTNVSETDRPILSYALSFEVVEGFKGDPSSVEDVEMLSCSYEQLPVAIGRQYLVYSNGMRPSLTYCNHTIPYVESSRDVVFARGQSANPERFSLTVDFAGFSPSAEKMPKIFLSNDTEEVMTDVGSEMRFRYYSEDKRWKRVRILFPYAGRFETEHMGESKREESNEIVYKIQSKNAVCDSRRITLDRISSDPQR